MTMTANELDIPVDELIAPTFYKPWEAFYYDSRDEIWMHGGRGSGKSSFISLAIITGLVNNPEGSAIVYRKVGDTLRESVFANLAWAVDILGLSHLFRLRYSPLEIERLDTGQRIMFRGADKPEKSKGVKLQKGYFKYLWFEELTEFSDMSDVRTIKASVLRGSDNHTITFYSYNPPMAFTSWVNEECAKKRKSRLVHKSSYLDMPKEWLGKTFLAEAEALKQSNEQLYRHMYLGEIIGVGEQVFSEFVNKPELGDRWTHVIKAFNPPKSWKIIRGYDWGYNKPFSVGWFAVDHDGCLYQILEYYGCTKTPNKGVRLNEHDLFAEVKRIEEEHPYLAGKTIEGVADPSIWDQQRGPSIADTAAKYGVYFEKGDNKRIPGWMQIHYRLRFDENGYPLLYIFDNCVNTIRVLPLMVYDENKPEDVDTDLEDHIPDMLRYVCMTDPINPPQAEEPPEKIPGPLDQELPPDKYAWFRRKI